MKSHKHTIGIGIYCISRFVLLLDALFQNRVEEEGALVWGGWTATVTDNNDPSHRIHCTVGGVLSCRFVAHPLTLHNCKCYYYIF